MSERAGGWLFVGAQVMLLLVLVALPARDDWPTPAALLAVAALCTLGGLIVIGVAIVQLGRAITPTPVPNRRGELITSGLYGVVRHPIYSGLLVVVIGVALRSGSFLTAAVAALTIAFFVVKSRWEERRLAVRYAEYAAYAATTPRFVPRTPGASR